MVADCNFDECVSGSRSLSCYQCKYYERLGRGHYDCKDPDEKYNIDCEDDENVCHYIHGGGC